MGKLYVGGGSGDVDTGASGGGGGGGSGTKVTVDVVSNIGSGPLPISDLQFTSDPVAVAVGQTVIVMASADLFNPDIAGTNSVTYLLFTASGPSKVRGPELVTPSVNAGDDFPLVAIAAFKGLEPGEYTFGLGLMPIRTLFTLNEWQIITQIIG
jgi:hypothetical protein